MEKVAGVEATFHAVEMNLWDLGENREKAVRSPHQYNSIVYLKKIEAVVTNIRESNVSLGIVKSSESLNIEGKYKI